MTVSDTPEGAQLALDLPGLTQPDAGTAFAEAAVRHQLAKMQADGYVTDGDVGLAALALAMAKSVDGKLRGGRASTISNDARVCMEILQALRGDEGAEVDDDLKAAMAEWSAVEEAARHAGNGPA